MRAVARKSCGEKRGERRDGAVYKPDQGRLYDLEQECTVDIFDMQGFFDFLYRGIHTDNCIVSFPHEERRHHFLAHYHRSYRRRYLHISLRTRHPEQARPFRAMLER